MSTTRKRSGSIVSEQPLSNQLAYSHWCALLVCANQLRIFIAFAFNTSVLIFAKYNWEILSDLEIDSTSFVFCFDNRKLTCLPFPRFNLIYAPPTQK